MLCCVCFLDLAQMLVYGGASVVNGEMHYPKDVYTFDLGSFGQRMPVIWCLDAVLTGFLCCVCLCMCAPVGTFVFVGTRRLPTVCSELGVGAGECWAHVP